MCDDLQCSFDADAIGWFVSWIGQRRFGFQALTQDDFGREAVEHALTTAVVGRVEPTQDDLQIAVAVERDAQRLALHPAVGALDHVAGLVRIGARLAVLHTVPLADSLEGIGREAKSRVRSEHG